MKRFLESKFRKLELIAPKSIKRNKPQSHKTFHVLNEDNDLFQSTHASMNQLTCSYCKGSHYIYSCKDFVKQPVEERRKYVKNNNLCFNCLIPNHNVFRCKQRTTCRICRRRHHSLLHQEKETELQQEENKMKQTQQEQKITTAHFSEEQPCRRVLLATAQVELKSRDGSKHLFRALIDQGSEASFVSARVVDLLGLTKTNINGVVSGIGEGTKIPIKYFVDLSVTSRFKKKETIRVKAYILKNISTTLPSKHVTANWPELQTVQLADPTFYTPGKIDILLGADVYCKIIENGLIKMPDGVVAQKTCLGWILSGQKEDNVLNNPHCIITLHATKMIAEDNDLLRRFREIEKDIYKKKKLLSKEEEACEEIYKTTTKRDDSGRFIIHSPLKQNIEETINLCRDTKQQAIKRFKYLEKRFEKNYKLKTELELKNTFHTNLEEKPIWEIFSTMPRMKGVLAYCKIMMRTDKLETRDEYLTANEMVLPFHFHPRSMHKVLPAFCLWKRSRRIKEIWKG